MSIMSMIRDAKGKVKQQLKERKAQRAVYDAHPELELKDLKAQRAALKQKADVRAERAKLDEMQKAERKEKIRSVVGFFGAPSAEAAKKASKGKPVNERAMNSVFELGSRDKEDRYSIGAGKTKEGFGLGGAKTNSAFGLPEKKRKGPFS